MNERAAPQIPPVRPGPIAFGIAVSVLVRFGVGSIPVQAGEPIALRWARVLADHPVRAALAAALLAVALRPRTAAPETPASIGGDRAGGGDRDDARSSH